RDPVNHEAAANRDGAEARASQAFGSALPGLSATASYTRNQWEVSFGGMPVLPRDQRDASVNVAVPLLDLAKFARISAARRSPASRRRPPCERRSSSAPRPSAARRPNV